SDRRRGREARHDPRRLRHEQAEQPDPRQRRAGERRDRDRPLVQAGGAGQLSARRHRLGTRYLIAACGFAPCETARSSEGSMSTARREPLNPLFVLMLLAGLAFTITAVAWAFVPVLEQKATDAGQPPPPSELRDALRANGGTWLLWELAVLGVLALAYMVLDRRRTLKKDRQEATITHTNAESPSGDK